MIPRTPAAIEALHELAQSQAARPDAVPAPVSTAQRLAHAAALFGYAIAVFLIVWFAAHFVKGLLA